MKLIEKLGRRYGEMTDNEKRIYDLLMADTKAFSLKSIGEVAEALSISKTTLMRFGKSMGFNGYADFKKTLQEEEVLDVSPAGKIKKIIQTDYALDMDAIREQEVENINATFSGTDQEDLMALADRIIATDSVHAMAWGISRCLVELLSLRLKIVGKSCESIGRMYGTLLEETAHLNDRSLLIVFELPPYVHEALDAVKAARKKGVHIVVVTDQPVCPLLKYADMSFCCRADTRFFGNSLTGTLFWVNMLTSQVIYQLKDKVLDRLEEQRSIFNHDRYYVR